MCFRRAASTSGRKTIRLFDGKKETLKHFYDAVHFTSYLQRRGAASLLAVGMHAQECPPLEIDDFEDLEEGVLYALVADIGLAAVCDTLLSCLHKRVLLYPKATSHSGMGVPDLRAVCKCPIVGVLKRPLATVGRVVARQDTLGRAGCPECMEVACMHDHAPRLE